MHTFSHSRCNDENVPTYILCNLAGIGVE